MYAKPFDEHLLSLFPKLEKVLHLGRAVLASSWGYKEKVLFVSKLQKVRGHYLLKYLFYWRAERDTPGLGVLELSGPSN